MSRPLNWHPLASSDPVPGSPDGLENGATHYARIATSIGAASISLTDVETMDGFDSDAVRELSARAKEVRESIDKVQARYDKASSALGTYATELRAAQGTADGALADAVEQDKIYHAAKDDESWWRTQANNAQSEGDEGRASRYRGHADDEAQIAVAALNSISALRDGALASAITRRDTAAEGAMGSFDELTDDGLNDGWWQDWGSKVVGVISKVASIVASVAGVLALVLCWVPVIGQALAAIALIATAVGLAADLTLALTGEQGWSEVIVGAIAMATFGLGRVVTSAFRLSAMTRGVQGATAVANTSAASSRAAMSTRVFVASADEVVVAQRTVVVESATIRAVRPAQFADVVAAKGGSMRVIGEALRPGVAYRETMDAAKGITILGDRAATSAAFAAGREAMTSGPLSARFAHAFVGTGEAGILRQADIDHTAVARLVSGAGAASMESAVLGSAPVGLTATGVTAVQVFDAAQTADGAARTVSEVSSPGFDFATWVTGEDDVRSAPDRLRL